MTVRNERTLGDLLVAEDDPAILEYRCGQTGVLLWPHIRVVFLRMMMSDLLYETELVRVGTANTSVRWRAALKTLASSVLHNARAYASNRCRAEICIVTDSLGTILVEGKWLNRLSDYFAHACPARTVVIEDHFNWKLHRPRSFSNVLYHAPRQVENFVVGHLRIRECHRRYAAQLVDLVCSRAQHALGWQIDALRRQQLIQMLARKLAGLPHQFRGYRMMLGRIAPKLLLINSACYGPAATLIAAARQRRIPIAEFQHGAISAGHDAYNFSETLRASRDYQLTLPDYFLGYGKWWIDQINAPVKKVAIGNPHRDAQIEKYARGADDRRDVLVLGDGIETGKYLAFAEQLVEPLRRLGLLSVFRPHPIERAAMAHTKSAVRIDLKQDIYESLGAARAVVSEQSSGLFEAIGFAKSVFVWNTSKARFGFPSHPFENIDSAVQLGQRLENPKAGTLSADDAAGIWAPSWRVNYVSFLKSCGVEP